jgi:hypothetical protein
VDPALVTNVNRAMAKSPTERFQTAEAMESALALWVAPNSARSAPESNRASQLAFAPTVVRAQGKRTRKTHAGKKRQAKPS